MNYKKKLSSRQMSSLYRKMRYRGLSKTRAFQKVGMLKKKTLGANIKKQKQWQKFGTIKRAKLRRKYKDSDRDGVPNRWDCQPYNKYRQDSTEDPYEAWGSSWENEKKLFKEKAKIKYKEYKRQKRQDTWNTIKSIFKK